MIIGFDAKRAYHNNTGLGNYSRLLMNSLMQDFPKNQYVGFNPYSSHFYKFPSNSNYQEVLPHHFIHKLMPSAWRSKWICKDIKEKKIQIYHGLSNELPQGIEYLNCKKVVSIHDLIFEHYPSQYNTVDVKMYQKKFLYASQQADMICAISEATKKDLIACYGIDKQKIQVCYQSCDDRFSIKASEDVKKTIISKYDLPSQYFISVGSIIERKNLLGICKAMQVIKDKSIPLLVIGKGKHYKQKVKKYLEQHKLSHKVIFLEDHFSSRDIFNDLPVLYQCAKGLIYPSHMEGFGIPILEAYSSGIPVITSNVSSLLEIGNGAACLIDPSDIEAIAQAMLEMIDDDKLREAFILKGYEKMKCYSSDAFAKSVMDLYESL